MITVLIFALVSLLSSQKNNHLYVFKMENSRHTLQFFPIILVLVPIPCSHSQNTKHMEHTNRPCEPNCGYLPLCLDTNAGNDTFFQNSWIPVPFNVHYQQNTVELQHFLPMFRYSVQNS